MRLRLNAEKNNGIQSRKDVLESGGNGLLLTDLKKLPDSNELMQEYGMDDC